MSDPDRGRPPLHREIELKLRLDPAGVAPLAQHDRLRVLATGPVAQRRLTSTYFDTPDLALRSRGLELRIRGDGDGWIQTVKRQAEGGGIERAEWEAPLPAPSPEPGRIDDRALRRVFAGRRIQGRLQPLFTVTVERRTWPVRLNATAMEVALDVGAIDAGGQRLPVCEAEIEFKSGAVRDLYRLARDLGRSVPLAREWRTKSDRGYALVTGAGTGGGVKAAPLVLAEAATTAQAMAAVGRSCMRQLDANVVAMLDAGAAIPDAVHQLRVSVRRMRSALAMFRGIISERARRRLQADLKRIAQRCGPAREWDVFAAEVVTPLQARLPDDAAVAWLSRAVEAERETARAAVLALLADPGFTDRTLEIEAWWEAIGRGNRSVTSVLAGLPIGRHAGSVLDRLHGKLRKEGKGLARMTESELHGLRIRAKKLRYAAEFFQSLYPQDETVAFVRTLVRLQDRLGVLNDAAIAGRQVETLAETRHDPDRATVARATGMVLGWNAARVDAALRRIPGAWDSFADAAPFWD